MYLQCQADQSSYSNIHLGLVDWKRSDLTRGAQVAVERLGWAGDEVEGVDPNGVG